MTSKTIFDFISAVHQIVSQAVPVVVGIGLLVFLAGLVRFLAHAGNEEAEKQGRQLMVWGIITLFVMVSVWGFVLLISQILGVPPGGSVPIPQFTES